jgi:hypothetical protein
MNYNIDKSMGLQDISFDLGRVGSENFPNFNSFLEIFFNNENIDFSLTYGLMIKLIDENGDFIMMEESYIFSLSKLDKDEFEGLYYDVKYLIICCQNKEFIEYFSGEFCRIQLCFGALTEGEDISSDFVFKVIDYNNNM